MTTARLLDGATKDAVILGTLESAAFILSLRNSDEFADMHSFGYHKIPHIGVYGADYRPTSPLVLLSLPARPKCLERLPFDLLNALDLSEIVTASSNLTAHILPNHTHPPLPQEEQYRHTARELVKLVLASAVSRVFGDTTTRGTPTSDGLFGSVVITDRWRMGKRDSAVSMDSCYSSDCTSLDAQYDSVNSRTVADEHMFAQFGEGDLSDDELRIIAKKLVMKAIHIACNKVDNLNRRSSIEYLIASTKRMKIEDRLSPPTLFEENYDNQTNGEVSPPSCESNPPRSTARPADRLHARRREHRSPTPTGKRGRKRERSLSQETAMSKEIEKFRQMNFGEKIKSFTAKLAQPLRSIKTLTRGSTPDRPCTSDNTLSPPATNYSPTLLQPIPRNRTNVKSLISNMGRLSIAESEAELDGEQSEEGECTILEAITREPLSSPPHLELQSPPVCKYQCNLHNSGFMSSTDEVPDMDYFIIVHTRPPPGLCQKFTCSNMDEVNVMYHCWLFGQAQYDPSLTLSERPEMGVFEPSGVMPVHLDRHDAGIPFQYMEPRTVCIHSCCFSPENAQLQLAAGHEIHSFYSAARSGSRRVVAFHVIPGTCAVEQELREGIAQCSQLGQLLETLTHVSATAGQCITQMVTAVST